MSDIAGAVLRMAIVLPLVLLVAYLSIKYGFMQNNRFFSGGNIRILEQVSLGHKAKICIVRVGEQYYLMGCSEQQVTLLKELDDYQEMPKTHQNIKNPWQELNSWLKHRRTAGKGNNDYEEH